MPPPVLVLCVPFVLLTFTPPLLVLLLLDALPSSAVHKHAA
jgi:hypothetical protein